MTATATDLHNEKKLYMALELSNSNWRLAFGDGTHERQVNIEAWDQRGTQAAIAKAKKRFGLGEDTRVLSCYEAGRDGFGIHRFLISIGVQNIVVDSASIEVNRKMRRAKTDKIDARKLLDMLFRYYEYKEKKTWSVVHVPGLSEEDERRPHRERERLMKEHTAHIARIRSLLVLHGVQIVGPIRAKTLSSCRDWQGNALAPSLHEELKREIERLELTEKQVDQIEAKQVEDLKELKTEADRKAVKLMKLKSVGMVTGLCIGKEFFGWRKFKNRRQVGNLAGLTGTPYSSGDLKRELGISKAGNARVRALMIELAWVWLRHQPQSELSKWFRARFAAGGKRMRRIGIVALARKLLIAFWKYVEFDEIPVGAIIKA